MSFPARSTRSISLLLALAALAACSQSDATSPSDVDARRYRNSVASILLNPQAATIAIGGSLEISATVRNPYGQLLTGRTITWSTSSAAVAVVNGSGRVEARGAGIAYIRAWVEGRADTTVITVPAGEAPPPPAIAPVASVTINPASAAVNVGGTVQLSATLRDASGNVLSGRAISWSSSAAAIASVGGTGLVTGLLGGSAAITAISEGRSASALITVNTPVAPPPPSGGFNEPAGYTLVGDRLFDRIATCSDRSTAEAGWDDIEGCPQISGGNLSIVTDAMAPSSASNVAQMRYPLGFAGGSSPAVAQRFWSQSLGYRQLYLRYWIKLSANFEGHMTSTNKIMHLWIGNPSGNRVFDRLVGVDQGPLDYQLALQGVPAAETRTRLTGNRGVSTVIQRNRWHRIEVQLVANTPGQSNGIARAWIDGVLAIDYSNVQLVGAGESPVWSQVQWSPTWGGGGDVTTNLFYMWLDQVYISAGQ